MQSSLLPELRDISNGQLISDQAWIKAHTGTEAKPEMPKLEVRFVDGQATWRIEWKLENRYPRRSGRDDLNIPEAAGEPGIFIAGNQPWKIWKAINDSRGPKFFGGNVKIKYKIHSATGIVETGEVSFKIRGENPDDGRCKAHIIANQGAVWYAWAVAKHESGDSSGSIYNQFAIGLADGGAGAHGAKGEPFYSPSEGDGWGLFQRDSSSDRSVTTQEAWSWDGNMKGFLQDEYPDHLKIANTYVDRIKVANPATFEEPQFMIEGKKISGRDILALTSYNGLQGQKLSERLTFHPENSKGQRWSKNLPNAPGNEHVPYVDLILRAYHE